MTSAESTKRAPEKVLVTGGGGFLGKGIVRALIQRGDEVRTFSRSDYPELRELGAEVVRGDLQNPEDVRRACVDRDVVFHVAAKVGVWGDYEDFYATNVLGTQHIVAACKAEGVKRLVHTSSPSVIFDGSNMEGVNESVPYPTRYKTHYPATKAEAERFVKASVDEHFRAIILRPHLIWGPEDPHLVRRILERAKQLRIIGKGTNVIDSIYIDNAIDAHIQASDALKENPFISGCAYFLTQDEPIVLWELINRILEAGGKPPIRRSIPYGVAYTVGAVLEGLYALLRIKKEPKMTRFVAGELAKSHWFDVGAARRDFGYDPQVSTDEGLRRLKAWLDTQS